MLLATTLSNRLGCFDANQGLDTSPTAERPQRAEKAKSQTVELPASSLKALLISLFAFKDICWEKD